MANKFLNKQMISLDICRYGSRNDHFSEIRRNLFLNIRILIFFFSSYSSSVLQFPKSKFQTETRHPLFQDLIKNLGRTITLEILLDFSRRISMHRFLCSHGAERRNIKDIRDRRDETETSGSAETKTVIESFA